MTIINVEFTTENSKYWYRFGHFGAEQRVVAVLTSSNARFPAAMVKAHIGPKSMPLILTQTFQTFLTLASSSDMRAGNVRALETTLSELLGMALMGRELYAFEQGLQENCWETSTVTAMTVDIQHDRP